MSGGGISSLLFGPREPKAPAPQPSVIASSSEARNLANDRILGLRGRSTKDLNEATTELRKQGNLTPNTRRVSLLGE